MKWHNTRSIKEEPMRESEEEREPEEISTNCRYCIKTFKNAESVKLHNEGVHGGGNRMVATFSCDQCPARFILECSLDIHKSDMHGKSRQITKYYDGKTCLICNATLSKTFVRIHIRNIHKIDPDTGRDIASELGEQSYCDHCDTRFSCPRNLASHNRCVHQDNFECGICGAPFSTDRSLKAHQYDRHDIPAPHDRKDTTCKYCEITFSTYSNLCLHTKNIHGDHDPNTATFSCHLCPAIFILDSSLKKHIKWHNHKGADKAAFDVDQYDDVSEKICSIKNTTCKYCEITFSTYSNLCHHIKNIHGDDDPNTATLSCHLCPAIFILDSSLKKHIRWHTNKGADEIARVVSDPENVTPNFDENKDSCEYCIKSFSSYEMYQIHVAGVHGNGDKDIAKFSCDLCPAIFILACSLDVHRSDMHGKKRTITKLINGTLCLICNTHYSPNTVRGHLIDGHKIDPDTLRDIVTERAEKTYCAYCQKRYASRRVYTGHCLIVHKNNVTCNICDAPFTTNRHLNQHIQELHNTPKEETKAKIEPHPDKPSWCEMCQRSYSNDQNLKAHIHAVHGGLDPKTATYRCDQCTAIFVVSRSLDKHLTELHGQAKPLAILPASPVTLPSPSTSSRGENFCDMCQKTLAGDPGLLLIHIDRLHGGFDKSKAPFSCDICSAMFRLEMSLSQHKLDVHDITDDRHFKCNICEKHCTSAKNIHFHVLRAHMVAKENVHKSYRVVDASDVVREPDIPDNWNCEFCNKSFLTKGNLKRHTIQLHPRATSAIHIPAVETTDDVVTYCKMCQKHFTGSVRLANYKLHMENLHGSQDKTKAPFSCNICDAIYVLEMQLSDHKLDIHGMVDNRQFKCTICDLRKNTARSIYLHMLKSHGKYKSDAHHFYQAVDEADVQPIPASKATPVANPALSPAGPVYESKDNYCTMCQKVVKGHDRTFDVHNEAIHGSFDPAKARFKCDICDAMFVRDIQLNKHKTTVHGVVNKQSYQCSICNIGSQSVEGMSKHLMIMHDIAGTDTHKHYREVTAEEARLARRTAAAADNVCEYCDNTFANQGNLKRHIRAIHEKVNDLGTESYDSDQYEISTTRRRSTRSPARRTSSPMPTSGNTCPVCATEQPSSRAISNHLRIAHPSYDIDLEKFACAICTEYFDKEPDWIGHLEDIHSDVNFENSLQCQACQKHVSKVNIFSHIKVHRNAGDLSPFACYICPKVASSEKYLNIHWRDYHQIADDDKTDTSGADDNVEFVSPGHGVKVTCSVCHVEVGRHNLSRHMRKWHNIAKSDGEKKPSFEKIFLCGICNIDHDSYEDLKRHQVVFHKNDPNLTLDPIIFTPRIINDAKIISETSAKDDDPNARRPITSQVLTNENFDISDRPRRALDGRYWCSSCSKSFASSGNLRQHFACHHLGFRFYCVECEHSFTCRSSFERHKCFKNYRELLAFAYRKFSINLADRGGPPAPKRRRIQKPLSFSCYKCDAGFPDKDSVNHHLRNIHLINPKTGLQITKSQIVEENTCKICFIELSSLSSLKRHIVSAHMDHDVNEKKISCPECDNALPENRLAIHLKFCQRVDSRTGEALIDTIPSSSSGFFDAEDCTVKKSEVVKKVENRTTSPEVVYEESPASNNVQSSDELPDVEELPPLEICGGPS